MQPGADCQRRASNVPAVRYPADLPIVAHHDELLAAIRRPPGGRRGRRDGLGQDHPAAQDVPRARPGRPRPDRAHPAAADRGTDRGRADRGGARAACRAKPSATPCGSPTGSADNTLVKLMTDGILLAELQRDRLLTAYDTDHRRRGPRAEPQHRLPPRLPAPAAAPPSGSQADRHIGDDRHRAFLPRTSGTPRSSRCQAAATPSSCDTARSVRATRTRTRSRPSATRWSSWAASRPATCSCS